MTIRVVALIIPRAIERASQHRSS